MTDAAMNVEGTTPTVDANGTPTSADQGYKTTLCQFYIQGECKNGETCTFAHGTSDLRAANGEKMESIDKFKSTLCAKFLQNGSCAYGASCRYAHGVREMKTVGENPLFKTSLCKSYLDGNFCQFAATCQYAHGPSELRKPQKLMNTSTPKENLENLSPAEKEKRLKKARKMAGYKTRMCANYKESDFCEYGDLCQFAHGEDELREETNRNQSDGGGYKVSICRKIQAGGTCEYGPKCRFAHNPAELRRPSSAGIMYSGVAAQTPPGYKTVLCSSYNDSGNCRYGSNCNFAHGNMELRHGGPPTGPPAGPTGGPNSFMYKSALCSSVRNNIPCPHGASCLYAHSEMELRPPMDGFNGPPKTAVCNAFRMTGFCNLGASCPMAHSPMELRGGGGGGPPTAPSFNGKPSSPMQRKTVMCRNVGEGGRCPRGNFCTFAHSEEELMRGGDRPQGGGVLKRKAKTMMCQNYVNNGGNCPYMEKCSFAHGRHELEPFKRPKN